MRPAKDKVMTKLPSWRGAARWPTLAAAAFIGALLTMVAGGLPAYASPTSGTTVTKIPISIQVFVPCANGGVGELVDLSGNLNDLVHFSLDNSGGLHVTLHNNPQGVVGAGETTGAKYQGTGVTEEHFNFSSGLPFTFTSVNNFRIIGQGPGNNSVVHENTHITINANGTITASVDNFKATC